MTTIRNKCTIIPLFQKTIQRFELSYEDIAGFSMLYDETECLSGEAQNERFHYLKIYKLKGWSKNKCSISYKLEKLNKMFSSQQNSFT